MPRKKRWLQWSSIQEQIYRKDQVSSSKARRDRLHRLLLKMCFSRRISISNWWRWTNFVSSLWFQPKRRWTCSSTASSTKYLCWRVQNHQFLDCVCLISHLLCNLSLSKSTQNWQNCGCSITYSTKIQRREVPTWRRSKQGVTPCTSTRSVLSMEATFPNFIMNSSISCSKLRRSVKLRSSTFCQ